MDKIYDTHAHLISDDWASYPPRPLRPELPAPARTDYTVTAESLVTMMDQLQVATACVVQRGHLYGYDNSYIIEAGRRFPDRLLPVVILDTQDAATPAAFTALKTPVILLACWLIAEEAVSASIDTPTVIRARSGA